MKESELTTQIIKALRGRGGFWFKVHGGAYQTAGIPDIVGCYRGHFVGLEVKLPGRHKTLTKRQRLMLHRIRRAKGTAAVVDSTWASLEALDRVDTLLDSDGGDSTPDPESNTEED